MKHGINFNGPIGSSSGYGNAVKNFALSFMNSNLPVKFNFSNDILSNYNLVNTIDNPKIDFFLYGPPWPKPSRNNQNYRIAYFYWEADKLPSMWNKLINTVNEIWAPCELVKNACINAGFKGKILKVPTPSIVPAEYNKQLSIRINDNMSIQNDIYKFYSIFQWQERKGYRELLTSYYDAFTSDDKVILILKVNPLKHAKQDYRIKETISSIKSKSNKKWPPKIFLCDKIVPSEHIDLLHKYGDCYVSSHHGEGWGMPIHDALLNKKQTIVTQFGGITEYLNNSSSNIIRHNLGPVNGMSWSSLYGKYQNWAYPSTNHLSSIFRDVYENHNKYKDKEINGFNTSNTMTVESISQIIYSELKNGR